MDTQPPQAVIESLFRVDSIEPVADPNGGSAQWYRYIISQGANTHNAITGTRCGSFDEISWQLNEMVEKLNERWGKLQQKKK